MVYRTGITMCIVGYLNPYENRVKAKKVIGIFRSMIEWQI